MVTNSSEMLLDFGNFRIVYFGTIAKDAVRILKILDSNANEIGNVSLVLFPSESTRNFSDSVDFNGTFWHVYPEYFPHFCEWFGIDTKQNKIVSRIDYAVDLGNLSCHDFAELSRPTKKRVRTDKINARVTWIKADTGRNELVAYDKRLDILDKGKHKMKFDKPNPFKPYLEFSSPIVRVEYRKMSRSLRELSETSDASIQTLFLRIREFFADHVTKFFRFDFKTVFEEFSSPIKRHKLPKNPDILVNGLVDDRAKHYADMFLAYAFNLSVLKSEAEMFAVFKQVYGERYANWNLRNSREPLAPPDVQSLF